MLITDVLQSFEAVPISTSPVNIQVVCTLCTSAQHDVPYKSTVICQPEVEAGRFVLSYKSKLLNKYSNAWLSGPGIAADRSV